MVSTGFEVLDNNTSDRTTRRNFLWHIDIRPLYHQMKIVSMPYLCRFSGGVSAGDTQESRNDYAPGLTPQAILEKSGSIRMIDAWFPTCDDSC
jgi:hypothetical protein